MMKQSRVTVDSGRNYSRAISNPRKTLRNITAAYSLEPGTHWTKRCKYRKPREDVNQDLEHSKINPKPEQL